MVGLHRNEDARGQEDPLPLVHEPHQGYHRLGRADASWAHHIFADTHSGKLLVQVFWGDVEALATIKAGAILENIQTELELELRTLRPLRDSGWQIRVQDCEFKQTLDDLMDMVRARHTL